MNNEDRLSDDCTAKGYNAIFYRTVQYLRMVFPQKHSYNQMEKNDFHTDQVEPQGRKESYGIAPTKHVSDPDIALTSCNRSREFCARGIHNALLSFKEGEFIAIMGLHGAGKTTLLKLLSGRLTCGCKQVWPPVLIPLLGQKYRETSIIKGDTLGTRRSAPLIEVSL